MNRISTIMMLFPLLMVSGCASNTALVESPFKSQSAGVLELLEGSANPNQADEKGRTPLHRAVIDGDETLVRTLINHHADIDAEDNEGHTPLYYAVTGGKKAKQFVPLLVEAGADLNKGSPLLYATSSEDMTYLINNGADIRGLRPDGLTSLHFAASRGYTGVVQYLLKAGMDINTTVAVGDVYPGYTPLMVAAKHGQFDMVELLLMSGADVAITGRDGETAASLVKKDSPYLGIDYRKIKDILSGAYKWISSADEGRPGGAEMSSTGSATGRLDDVSRISVPVKPPISNAVALVIGNRNYLKGNIPDVTFAHNDARMIRDTLVNQLGYDPGNIIFELDASLATLNQVLGTRGNPRGKAYNWVRPGQSDLFVYYVGHGAPDTRNKGAYLVPVDADVDYLEASAYPLNQFYENISKIPARSLTVVLDACFSGDSEKGTLIKAASPLLISTEVPIHDDERTTVFESGGPGQISSWYEEVGHSLFTYYFIKGLEGESDRDKDETVTVGELEIYLTENVPYMARRLRNREQTPRVWGDKEKALVSQQ